jgi:hypothetical protein
MGGRGSWPATLLNGRPELDWNHFGVGAKVGIGSEDLPPANHRNTADQEINSRSNNASTAAFVAPVRRPFIIPSGQSFIRKSSQLLTQLFELRSLSNTGKQLLTNWPDKPRATVLNKFLQRCDSYAFGLAKPAFVPSQSQRPDTGVDEYLHLALFLAFRLVVVFWIEIHGAKRGENLQPLTVGDILGKSRSYRFFLGFVMSDSARFFDQVSSRRI